ncbi:Arm DNA-binding domain-containing protein, partial [Bartonella sp. AP4SXKL]|uniref:Arm DNA-binding domain-containing protein n=1 Tax=Bartonella sp. AP4SXKL TaxID=3243496 RepID=UPI0035CF86CA
MIYNDNLNQLKPLACTSQAGLLFHKHKDGGAQWILRYTLHGRRREMGLGALRDVSLKQARELATRWRAV